MTDDLRKFIDLVDQEWRNDELFEMANITPKYHGIENVVIWVGLAPKNHGLRVKVSNVPGRMDMDNSFVIMMPNLDYDPKAVAKWITPKTMRKILQWIALNQKLLFDYETGLITDTVEFVTSLSKV